MDATLLGLLRSGLFNGVEPSLLADVPRRVTTLTVPAGEWVVREGEPADAFFVVLEGELDVHADAGDGSQVRVGTLRPAEHFGEQALLAEGDARRSASVRGSAPSSVVARLEAPLLRAMMDQDTTLRRRLLALRERYLQIRLARSTALVRALLADAPAIPRDLAPEHGTVLFRQGDPAGEFYVVQSGWVELFEEGEGLPVRVARLGAGLCVGDRDTDTRAVTARTDGETRLLAFPRAALAGAAARSPDVRAHLAAVQQVGDLPQRGFVTQYFGTVEGVPCLTLAYALKGGRRLVATHFVGHDALRLEVAGGVPARTVETPDGDLSVVVAADGAVCAVSANRRTPVLSLLFGRAISDEPLRPDEEARLARTGALQLDDDGMLCACLRIRRSVVQSAIDAGATDVATLQARTGAGQGCGTCLAHVREMLQETTFVSALVTRIDAPTPTTRRVWFADPHGGQLPAARPGQHVVLRVVSEGSTVERPYTLSGAAGGPWEILVKREPGGIFGGWLFDRATTGARLEVSPPQGDCVWDGGPAPVVCFVAGIGVTPALAFARTLVARGWPHRLVIDWSTRAPGDAALLGELRETSVANLTVRTRYTSRTGRIAVDDVRTLVRRLPGATFFVCGPDAYMADVCRWLGAHAVPPARVRVERFRVGEA